MFVYKCFNFGFRGRGRFSRVFLLLYKYRVIAILVSVDISEDIGKVVDLGDLLCVKEWFLVTLEMSFLSFV